MPYISQSMGISLAFRGDLELQNVMRQIGTLKVSWSTKSRRQDIKARQTQASIIRCDHCRFHRAE